MSRRSWIAGPSVILAQASVNLYAVALVWILPNLSFATAMPPLTGAHTCDDHAVGRRPCWRHGDTCGPRRVSGEPVESVGHVREADARRLRSRDPEGDLDALRRRIVELDLPGPGLASAGSVDAACASSG